MAIEGDQTGGTRMCYLLADEGPETQEARRLLEEADIPFEIVRAGKDDPAPQLFAPEGRMPGIGAIRAYVDLARARVRDANGLASA